LFTDIFLYHEKAPITFNSGLFLWLFAGFYLVYWWLVQRGERETFGLPAVEGLEQPLPSNHHTKLLFVTFFSWYFYYKSSGLYFLLLVWATVLDYNLGHWIANAKRPSQRNVALVVSIVSNLGLLFYFKYTNFFIDCLQSAGAPVHQLAKIALPVGISFYTFQSISYVVDIYRNKLKPVESILEYAFFVSFFPQLVAGPIVRAYDFIPQISKPTFLTRADFGRAVFLLLGGLFKKVVIADYIALNFVDRIFEKPLLYTGFENLMGAYGYALRIYCDFSGYSDMAIAIALLLGFHFPTNFNSPYQAASVTEFWRRWHISLSSWLRDYVYIPLGGNKIGSERTYANLLITMLVGGFWHGGAWRFILWGALHGGALAIERFAKQYIQLPDNLFVRSLRIIVVFHFVCLCWLPFCAPEMSTVWAMLTQIFTAFHAEVIPEFINGYRPIVLLMGIGYLFHFLPADLETLCLDAFTNTPVWVKSLAFAVIVWLVVQVKSADIQPFIYFMF
jgi:D-alanyl-lipoteichoic acid acyltransferase DltB (MBOAT superfamily)